MNNYKKWLGLILMLSLLIMACGLGNRAAQEAENAQGTAEAVAQETAATAEAVAKEAEAEVEKAKEEVSEAVEEVKEEVEAATETEAENSEAANTEAAGDAEEAPLEIDSIAASLAELSSYRVSFKMDFEGTNSQGETESGTINMQVEATKDPEAVHLEMAVEGPMAADLGGSATIQVYNVDGTTYMQNPEDQSWMSLPGTGGSQDIFSGGPFAPDSLIDLPKSAKRDPLPQTVNGISTWHYTFDESDLTEEDLTIENAAGEIWVAQDAGYPVKIVLDVTGSSPEPSPDDLFASGTFHMEYELLDVNADFTITVPEEALNAESPFDGGLDPTSPEDIEWPMLESAEVQFAMEGMVSYMADGTVADAVDFYKTELSAQGWTADSSTEFVSEESGLLAFTKDGETLNLVISKDQEGKVSVILSTEQ